MKKRKLPLQPQKTRVFFQLYFNLFKNYKKVDTLSYKTKSAKKEEVERNWYIVDAENQIVGPYELSKIATVLRGKHKPSYTPHVDTGDYVIVINADKVRFTGGKVGSERIHHFLRLPRRPKKTCCQRATRKETIMQLLKQLLKACCLKPNWEGR